jgi:hypothetical protein
VYYDGLGGVVPTCGWQGEARMVHEPVCNEWLPRIIVHEMVDGMTAMALDCNGFDVAGATGRLGSIAESLFLVWYAFHVFQSMPC